MLLIIKIWKKDDTNAKYHEFDDVSKAMGFVDLAVSRDWRYEVFESHKVSDLYVLRFKVFCELLIKRTETSKSYAASAWHTLEDWRREKPEGAVEYYIHRFSLEMEPE